MTDMLETIRDDCIRGRRAELLRAVNLALASGIGAETVMTQALIPAMSVVGERYSTGEYFLAEMMLGARAMSEAMQLLEPHLAQGTYETKARVVLGTVAGDYHDIGKNIVGMMLQGGGYEVVDLGVDVSPQSFVEAIAREKPRLVLMSALLTLTMEGMRATVQALVGAGVRERVVVGIGGAPLTQNFADEIGADFYAADAHDCVVKCNQLLHSGA